MKLNKRAVAVLLCLLASAMIIAGCGKGTESKSEEKEQVVQEETPAVEETVDEEEATTRLVTTIVGEVEVPVNPQRIALTYHDDIDHVMALGIKPVAVPTYERTGHIDGYMPYLADELKGVEKIGNVPSFEAIMSTEPDLIIAGYFHQEAMEELNKIAPTLFFEWKSDWRITHLEIGRALGFEEQAQANVDEFNSLAEAAKKEIEAAIADETVAYVHVRPKDLVLYGALQEENLTSPGFLLYNSLGLTPAKEVVEAKDWGETISNEIFATLSADHIFLHVSEDADAQARAEELLESPLYQNVPAIKNEQIYVVPSFPWNRGGPIAFKLGIEQVLDALVGN